MLQRYHDGDLSEPERAQVESGLAAHPDAQDELKEIELIGEVLRETTEASADAYDPARIWAGIEPQLGTGISDEPVVVDGASGAGADPSFLDRLVQWFTPPRLVPIGALAAAAVAWMVISTPGPAPHTPSSPTPSTAPGTDLAKPAIPEGDARQGGGPKPPKTAIAEAPTEPAAPAAPATAAAAAGPDADDDGVIIDSIEAEDADVVIGKTAGKEKATVIWLFADADTALEND